MIEVIQADRDAATNAILVAAADLENGNIGGDEWLAELFARHRTTSLAAQDGLVEALEDATIDEIILNFAGGIVQVPSKHNPRGYVSYYRPREAMRAALSAIKGDKS